ncbi:L,D-transpeptidase [Streptomyces sp. Go-475]|uniref:L,D-transpeptidase n=1 Tax=Streptomyces sp. Go-475 TaxID=2072505 RepID=UPI000DF025D5|nr:L,D-transpeptidase [Streptomyces sp. Go-475]AXE86821.1 L,D-transpeptidase catalytic domain [Streptomyces sp. Go-475]
MSDDLTDLLHEVADRHRAAPPVPGREIRRLAERRGRRRRAAYAGGAAAVALALAGGLALAFTGHDGARTAPPAAASATATSRPSPPQPQRATAAVDLTRHELTLSGRRLPVSGGTAQHPTPTGRMTVVAKYPERRLPGAAVGLGQEYDVTMRWVVELRAADGTTNYLVALTYDEQAPGERDVTHGWIGLRSADAKWCYQLLQPGDIVRINRTGPAPG